MLNYYENKDYKVGPSGDMAINRSYRVFGIFHGL